MNYDYDYYHLPEREDDLLHLAENLRTEDIVLGKVNVNSLCYFLAQQVRILRRTLEKLKAKDEKAVLAAYTNALLENIDRAHGKSPNGTP